MGKLSSAIVQRKLASLRDVEEALARQVLYGGDLATNLLEQAPRTDEQALIELLAETHQLQAAPAGELPRASVETRSLVPGDVAFRHGLYPLERAGDSLVIAVSEPMRPEVEQDLRFGLGVSLVQRVAPLVRVRQAISRDYRLPLDRRTERVVAKLEGKPDPSPSMVPSAFAAVPDITSLPRPPSIPALGLPGETSPSYGAIGLRAPQLVLKAPVTIHAPTILTAPVVAVAEPEPADESIHERLTAPAPAVAPRTDEGTRPWPVVIEPNAALFSRVTAPTPPGDPNSTPPAPDVSRPPAVALPSEPPRLAPHAPPERRSEPPPTTTRGPSPTSVTPHPGPPRAAVAVASPSPSHAPSVRPSSIPPGAPRRMAGFVLAPTADEASRRGRSRHRGPYTAAEAEKDLLEADGRDGVLAAFFDFCCQYFEYSVLFAVHGDLAEGRMSRGPGADQAKVNGIGVPLDLPGSLATVRAEGRFNIAPLAKDGLDARLAIDLERRADKKVLLLPLTVRDRCVLILYGDHGAVDVALSEIGDVLSFSSLVATALENVILRKKTAVRRAVDGDHSAASIRPSLRPRSLMPSREERVDALAQALETTVRPVTLPEPPRAEAESTSKRIDTKRGIPSPAQPPPLPISRHATPAQGTPRHASVPPPAELGTPVFALSKRVTPAYASTLPDGALSLKPPRPTPRVRAVDDGPAIESQEVEWSADDEDVVRGVPDSQVVVAAKLPVKPHSSEELRLPTVILNIDHDLDALVNRLLRGDEGAIDGLVQHGVNAASLLVSQFPGPVTEDSDRLAAKERASERGPVLKALARIGLPAVPFLVVRSNDREPSVRAWATQLLGEIATVDSAHAVARRVSDAQSDVRRAAIEAGRLLQADEDARTALRDAVLAIAEDKTGSVDTRVAALEALAHFRDGRAVPRLVKLVAGNDDIGQSAQWALGLITRQALGRDVEAWDTWWRANADRHRIEWLIDSLMHDDADIRRATGEELKTLTKEYFGYYDDLSAAERGKAQRRYQEWWESAGKARFGR